LDYTFCVKYKELKRREMTRQTILPPEMRGVMKVSGYRGIGKTSLLIQADIPDNVCFLDFEAKGEGFHNQLHFGFYKSMTSNADGPDALYDVVTNTIKDLEQDKYTVCIIDNGSPLELALQASARRNTVEYCQEYGLNIKNVRAGRFGGLRSVVNYLVSDQICGKLHSKGIELIGITHHSATRWGAGGPIPNKKRIKGADRWMELSILSVILVPGDFPPVPSGIIEKEQLSTISFNQETMKFTQVRRLPRRMPLCTFERIQWYLDNPANLENPAEGEAIVEDEYAVFDEKLNREQITIMRLALEKDRRENGSSRSSNIPAVLSKSLSPKQVAIDMKKDGRSNLEIKNETGLSVPEILKL